MEINNILQNLNKQGYHIVDDFLSEKQILNLKRKLDSIINSSSGKNNYWSDNKKSDQRIYGIDRIDNEFRKIFDNDLLNTCMNKYLNLKNPYTFVMANKLDYKKGNLGSGGGWHRDTFKQKQLKFICYLTDVSTKNGAFQIEKGSHKLQHKIIDFISKPRRNMRRYPAYNAKNCTTLTGDRGTLLIVDTSSIHRGKPIEVGNRYALTYYINDKQFSKSLLKRISE